MKKFLRALDDAITKPVEGSDDIKKPLSIITEGTTTHKVSLPVQMAMQHYAAAMPSTVEQPSLLKRYFAEAEEAVNQSKIEKRQLINQYAKIIAERVLMKESSATSATTAKNKNGMTAGISADPQAMGSNPVDIIKMDVPLLLRVLEYAREDAKTDIDLHNVVTKLIDFGKTEDVLTMTHYEAIVGEQMLLPDPSSNKHVNMAATTRVRKGNK